MALIHVDGFDHYTTPGNTLATMVGGVYGVGAINARFNCIAMPVLGGYAASFANQSDHIITYSLTPKSAGVLGVGFHFYYVGINISVAIISFLSSTGSRLHNLYVNRTLGQLQLRSNTTVIDSVAITNETVYHIEVKQVFGGAGVGTIEVKLDGVLVMSHTSNTSASAHGIGMGITNSGGSNSTSYYMDNLYIWDETGLINNDWIGPMIVDTLLPTSDETEADWTPATGSDGYAMVDNVPVDPAQYVEGDTAGDISKFGVTYAPPFDATVRGVAVYMKAMRTGVADEDVLFGIDAGTVDGEITVPAQELSYRKHIVELNPDTGVAWTLSDIANSKLHIERLP